MTNLILYSHMRTLISTPQYIEESWPALCDRLDLSAQDSCDPKIKNGLKQLSDKDYLIQFGFLKTEADLPSLLSSVFRKGDSRLIDNVLYLGNLFIADIDHTPISFEDMAKKLDGMGINYYLYPTTNHTANNPSYRLLLPLDRDMEVYEYAHLWDAMNYKFDNTFDPQTKDIVRMGFMPRAWGGIQRSSRHAINKAHLVANDVLADYPVAPPPVTPLIARQANQTSAPISTNVANLNANLSRSSAVNIEDYGLCPFVTDKAKHAYKESGGRYFTFMCRVAAAALKSNYDIQPAELVSLANQADTAFGVIKERKGAMREAQRAIEASVKYLGPNVTSLPTRAIAKAFQPPVVPTTTNMVVRYIDAACGAGKSYGMIEHMLKNKGRYIYACDKISTLKERRKDFRKRLKAQYSSDTLKTETVAIFKPQSKPTKDEYGSIEETDDTMNVMKRISVKGFNINKKFNSGDIDSGVIFITHRAAQMMDWSQFKDYELIIDEVPDVLSTFSRTLVKSTIPHIQRYLTAGSQDGDTYPVKLSTNGRKFLSSNKHDDLLKSIVGLMRSAADAQTSLWVMKEGWDQATAISNEDDDYQSVTLTFFSLFKPESMKPFKQVYLLGDELLKSRFKNAWEKIGGVTFLEAGFWDGGRTRDFPLRERATIHYFMNKNASFDRFEREDDPLLSISEWLVRKAKGPVLYTCNERFKSNTVALELGGAKHITPKAHGLNGLQDYANLVWLAAMRSSGQEYNITRNLINMTSTELDRDKEFNAAYQMIMRGVLRKFDSDEHCDIYVVSKAQADYLSERLDGCEIKHIPNVVKEKPKIATATTKTEAERRVASAESSRRSRAKAKAEKELMEGPKSAPKTSTERNKKSSENTSLTAKPSVGPADILHFDGLIFRSSGSGAR